MSIDYEQDRQRYRVRWREGERQRSRRFRTREEAERFADTLEARDNEPTTTVATEPDGGGVYAYETFDGRVGRGGVAGSLGRL